MRNCITDDQLGVGEALIEIAYNRPIVARGSHYLTLGLIEKTSDSGLLGYCNFLSLFLNFLIIETTGVAIQHDIATRKLLDSWIFLSVPEEASFEEYKAAHLMQVKKFL